MPSTPVLRTGGLLVALMLMMGAPSRAQPLPDTLTFERATTLLAQHNPQLRTAQAQARAEGRAARAESLYPNPSLSISEERTNLPDGVDDQWYTSITQPIRYPGEHSARSRAAEATERAAGARIEETHTQLFNTLRHRYLDVVAAQARVDVLASFASSVRSAAEAARVRAEEGDLGTVRRTRMQVAQARYENDLANAEQRLQTARTELSALLLPDAEADLDPGEAVASYRVPGTLQFRAVDIEPDAALRRALQNRGAIQSASARLDARSADRAAAEYKKYPSLSISAGPKRQSVPSATTYGYTAGLSIGLPLWNGGETAVEAQEGRREAAAARLEATRRQVEVEVQTALKRLTSYRERIRRGAGDVLADTDSLGADARFVYQQGEISLFELLDALDAAAEAARLRIDRTTNYLRALYDLEAAMGVGPDDDPLVIEGALRPRNPDLQ